MGHRVSGDGVVLCSDLLDKESSCCEQNTFTEHFLFVVNRSLSRVLNRTLSTHALQRWLLLPLSLCRVSCLGFRVIELTVHRVLPMSLLLVSLLLVSLNSPFSAFYPCLAMLAALTLWRVSCLGFRYVVFEVLNSPRSTHVLQCWLLLHCAANNTTKCVRARCS